MSSYQTPATRSQIQTALRRMGASPQEARQVRRLRVLGRLTKINSAVASHISQVMWLWMSFSIVAVVARDQPWAPAVGVAAVGFGLMAAAGVVLTASARWRQNQEARICAGCGPTVAVWLAFNGWAPEIRRLAEKRLELCAEDAESSEVDVLLEAVYGEFQQPHQVWEAVAAVIGEPKTRANRSKKGTVTNGNGADGMSGGVARCT